MAAHGADRRCRGTSRRRPAGVCKNEDVGTQKRIEACTSVVDLAKDDDDLRAEALLQRGVLQEFAGDKDAAVKDYSEVIKLDPSSAVAYFNRGNVYDQMGEHDRAIADYTEAIKIDPTDPDVFNNRGQAYDAQGESDSGNRRLFGIDPAQPRQSARFFQPRTGLRQ